jgi:hypoxanthine phosphoribosyltransferase
VLDDISMEATRWRGQQRLLDMGGRSSSPSSPTEHQAQQTDQGRHRQPHHPDKFVIGFGMDVHGYWRNLPGLWALRRKTSRRNKPAGLAGGCGFMCHA